MMIIDTCIFDHVAVLRMISSLSKICFILKYKLLTYFALIHFYYLLYLPSEIVDNKITIDFAI